MKKLLKGLAIAAWAGVLPMVCGAAQIAAPGNFSGCEVLSYAERASTVAAQQTSSPTKAPRRLLSAAPGQATVERSWVVRSSSNSNVTYAVKQTLNAATGGEISMCAYSPNRVIATLLKGKSYADFVAGMTSRGFKVVRELMKDLQGNSVYVIESTDTEHDVVDQMTASIQSSGFCDNATIARDHIYSANMVPNDGKWADQWNMVKIGAPKAWNTRTDASSVLVAVLDTGVNFDHIDLNQNLWMNPIETADMGNGEDDDGNGIVDDVYGISSDGGNVSGNPMDENGHGSHCAGIIGAVGNNRRGVAGVAWRAKIMGLKFLNADGNGCVSDAITCLSYAAQKGVKIVNCSFGSTDWDDYFYMQVQIMAQRGVIFVCAAGNATNGMPARDNDEYPFYPCNYPCSNIVSVAATDADDNLASFSYFGAQNVDIAAPGVDIESSVLGSMTYDYKSGTSMATPHVVGALALLMAEYPDESPYDIVERLYAAGEEVAALKGKVRTGKRLSLANFFGLPAPSAVTASQGTIPDAVSLYWTAVENASHYRVWRADAEDGAKTALCEWTRGLTFSDETALPGSNYWYFVQAAASAEGADASAYSEGVPGFRPEIPDDRVTVSFDANGGTVAEQKRNYTAGDPYGEFPAATYAEHVFLGWHTAAEGGTRVDDVSVVRQDVTTLYAHWSGADDLRVENLAAQQRYPWNGKVDVMFDLNGVPEKEYASLALTAKEEGEEQGFALATYDGNAPTNLPAGNHRVIWNADADKPNALFENLTLNATASIDVPRAPASGTASNNVAAGGIDLAWTAAHGASSYEIWRSTSSTLGSAAKLLDCAELTCLDGSCAMGTYYYYWIKSKSSGGTSPDALALEARRGPPLPVSLVITGNTTVRAGGSIALTATATYNDGTSKAVTPNWSITSGSSYGSINSSGTFTANGTATQRTVTVKASYTDNGVTVTATITITITTYTITVTFNGNGGSPTTQTQTYTAYGTYGSFPSVSRTGYTPSVWYTSSSGGSQVTTSSVVPSANTTLYAHWVAIVPSAPTSVSATDGTYSDKVSVSWSAVSGATTYYVYRYTSNSSGSATQIGSTSSTSYNDTSAVAGTTYWYWVKAYRSDNSQYSAFSTGDSGFVKEPVVSLAGAVDNTDLTFTTGGDAIWIGVKDVSYDGTDSARSGIIGAGQSTRLQTTVTGPGTFTFRWKVSSESGCDTLTFYVDDSSKASISGTSMTSFEQKTFDIAAGSHILKWTYKKDGSVDRGSDCGWVDTVAYTRITVPSAPTGVSATDGTYSDKVVVSWNAVSGAASYEIWRNSSSSTGSATKIGTSTTTSYNDTTVPAGSTYCYWVKAVNVAGTSGWSSYDRGSRVRSITGLTLEGPEALPSGCSGAYRMKLNYSDGTQSDVTSSSYVTWSIPTNEFAEVSSSYTSDSEHGYYRTLTAKTVTSLKQVVVTAKYSYNGTTVTGTLTVSITPSGNLAYSYRLWPDGTGSLTDYLGSDKTTVTSLVLPSSINGVTIRGTTGRWMQNLSSLTSVTIPSTFGSVSDTMFYYCSKLTSVSIPNSVTNIGSSAFRSCSALQSVSLPSTVETIGLYAFGSCTALKEMTIPSSVKTIGSYAFSGCSSLSSITIPDSVKSLSYAFEYCSGLKTVSLPDSLTSINAYSFYMCTNLTAITVGSNNTAYKDVDGVLFSKDGKTLIKYPDGKVGSYAIPSGTTTVGEYAFCNSPKLTSLTIPASVTSIHSAYGIYNCSAWQSISVNSANPNYLSVDGVLYNKNMTTLLAYPGGKTATTFVMPDSVRVNNEYYGSANLTNLVWSDSLRELYGFCEGVYATFKIPNGFTDCDLLYMPYKSLDYLCIPAALRVSGTWSAYPTLTVLKDSFWFGDWPFSTTDTYGPGRYYHFSEVSYWGSIWKSTTGLYAGGIYIWQNPIYALDIDGENKVFAGQSIPLYAKGYFSSGHFGIASKANWMVVSGSSYASVNPSNGTFTAKGDVTTTRNISVYAETTLGGAHASAGQYNVQIVPANTNKTVLAFGKYAYNRLRWLPVANAVKYNIRRGTSSSYGSASVIDTYLKETLDGTETYVDSSASLGTTYYYWVEALDANGNSINVSDYATAARATGDLTYVKDVLTKLYNGTYTESSFVSDAEKGILKEINYWKGVNSSWVNYIRTGSLTSISGANEMFWRSIYDLNTYIGIVMTGMADDTSPSIVDITAASPSSVTVKWVPKLGVASYQIYRGISANAASATKIATVADGTSYTDTSLHLVGTRYYYWVKAVTPSGTTDFGEACAYVCQPTYLVVDLSAGSSATEYPTRTMWSVSSEGWDDGYKTTNLVLRLIQPGTFVMGSPDNDEYRSGDFAPHKVTITKPYYMGVFEVTQKQFQLICDSDRAEVKGDLRPVEYVSYCMIRGQHAGIQWPLSNCVDSTSFMGIIRSRTHLMFDLPTEAQWEYACRAGTTTALNNGKGLTGPDDDDNMAEVGRYRYNQGDGKGGYSSAHTCVGSYAPNNWGLYDMHGNVWEWCLDNRAYRNTAGIDSGDAVDPVGPIVGSDARVLRGGCCDSSAKECRSASRTSLECTTVATGRSGSTRDYLGFRVCCPADETIPQVAVAFDANGGEGTMSAVAVETGKPLTLPTIAFCRDGYYFAGWATDAEDDVIYADGATIPRVVSGMTLYAKWVPQLAQTYVMIDLSAGTNAASYPVSELEDVPSGGWTEEYKTTKLVLRRIPSGSYTMGCEEAEVGYIGSEAKPHQVTISKPFYMGVFQVTQKQYELVMGSNPSSFKGDARPVESVSYNAIRGSSEGAKWPSADTVDATSFMGKIRARTGLTFDLPTEAQWEYACRAGTTTALNSGKNLTNTSSDANMAEVGRYTYNQSDGKGGYSSAHTTVGSYLPNNWGLYDMHGNVWEWCLDWYVSRGTSGFDTGAETDPKGAASGSNRVIRGGSWDYVARGCRSAHRNYYSPSSTYSGGGFRLCCPIKQSTVSFDANGGTGTMPPEIVDSGRSLVLPTMMDFSRDGYAFAGWATDAAGDVVYADGAAMHRVTSDMTLYAKWVPQLKQTYVVIDLSAGANATNYPICELEDVPEGGWTAEYKTKKLVLRRIPNGSFMMGSPLDEVGRFSSSGEDLHQVTITKPFYMGVFEVTQKQYELVMGGGMPRSLYQGIGSARPVECVSYIMIRGTSAGANWPLANSVDAISFMGKIRSRTGLTFDLPTEAQWEYACRAGTTTALNSGCNLTNAYDDANMNLVGRYEYNSGRGDTPCDGKGNTTYAHAEVGAYLANNWGLYDMHGNVDEWCLDRYVSSLGTTAVVDPKGAASGASRVLRGGSWDSHALSCRSAYRNGSSPVYSASGRGFRLCCPAGETTDQVTVAFDANGGSGTMAAVETGKGGSFAIPKVAFVRTGCAFLGWATSASGDVVYADEATIPCMSENMTLYAKWAYTPTQTYLVIDLSAGADANEYAISELSRVPPGGWTDEYKTTKLVLRRIANGSFTMGCETNEVGYSGNEARPHQVSLSKPYYMGVFQVTQKQYELVMGSNHYYAYKGDARPQDQVSYDVIRGSSEGMKWPSSNSVDATTFMGKIRARTGLTFDLPTEAQWEYACRAGTTTALNSGKNLTGTSRDANMAEVGRYAYNTDDGKGGYSTGDTTVGSYIANNWGLYDMHGNVSELCLDWYVSRGTRGFDSAAVTDPKGGESGSGRVRRGGRWDFIASWCRSAYRNSVSSSNLNGYTGFRLCCPAGDATDQVMVTFDANGGTGTMTAVSVGNGGSMVVPECAFSRSGHVFAGWATSSSGSEVYEAGATIPSVTSALTLYAKWSAPSKTYLVVDLSGGTTVENYPLSELDDVPSGGWTDEYKTTKLVLRRIANGSYMMGCETTETGYLGGVAKPHQVTISKPFYMGVFEVTQKQYELVMGSNPSSYKGDARPVEDVTYNMIRGSSEGAKWPSANAADSTSFMGKIRARTGLFFDLSTEAQWEYACRAGTTTALNSGKNLTSTTNDANMAEVGRYGYNSGCYSTCDGKGGYSSGHTTVGSYQPNSWGLYDMHGNVWEWCLDWYVTLGINGFDSAAVTDPKGVTSGAYRVFRGGSWDSYARDCRSANRSCNFPSNANGRLGFRLCCPAGEATDQVTVMFDANGGTGTMAAVETGKSGSFAIPKVAFVRTGYPFQGWATSASGDVVYADGATIPCMSENMTLYAKWAYTPTQTYLVIDLSAGAGATNYPVSYLDDVPPGGWTDEYKTNKLVLRRIANGSYTMGCETNEVGYSGYEAKPHQVTISKPFYMGVFEVTQKQYELVMGSNPSSYKGDARPVEYVSYNTIRGSSSGAKWPSTNSVDSTSFMGKIRARTGLTFDLPTEAQWEYACRAGTTTALNSGKNLTSTSSDANMAEVGRYTYNTSDGKGGYSSAHTTVGSYLPNNWGLYDMHGNVLEWCLDWYVSRGTSGFDSGAVTDPKGAASGSNRVLRGGSWISLAQSCRSASRYGYGPSSTGGNFGFRLCCPAGEATDQVTVTFDANGGTGTMAPVETGKGGSFAIPKVAFVRTGYEFQGWATSASGDVVYADGATIPCMSENMTLYAKWAYTPTQTYLVIDLSAGADANEYAISELSSVPSGGWTDEYKTTKLVLRRIANGSFTMGSPADEVGCDNGDGQHQVTISKPFYMGIFEVTQRQYELVMGSNPSMYKGDARPVEYVSYNTIRGSSNGAKWPSTNSVDSTSFMGKIRARTGLTFDLPTEAQWEYACRAGTTTALNSGKNLMSEGSDSNMDEVGRYYYNRSDGKGGYSAGHTTVGSYLPNNWGLYDMHGNVCEWCLDWYVYVSRGTSGFDSEAVTDPKGASSGSCRVYRGGSSYSYARSCRSAYRGYGSPSDNYNSLGFRLSMTLP